MDFNLPFQLDGGLAMVPMGGTRHHVASFVCRLRDGSDTAREPVVSAPAAWPTRSPARDALWRIPGVVQLGFGWKERQGDVLPEWALRVHVVRKRPLTELSPEEQIPGEVDGLQTDVVVAMAVQHQCSNTAMHPGMKISADVPNASDASGTLGCLVRKGGAFYILTNQHVLMPVGGPPPSGKVYQPIKNVTLNWECNDPVANTPVTSDGFLKKGMKDTGGKKYYLDCGLTTLVPGIGCENKVPGGNLAAGIRDLSAESTLPVPGKPNVLQPATLVTVHKVGAITGDSAGVVTELCHEESGGAIVWEIRIKSTSGPSYDEVFDIHPDVNLDDVIQMYSGESIKAHRVDPDKREVRFVGIEGTRKGDSGSVWYDDQKRVVGLHYAGGLQRIKIANNDEKEIPTGRASACHIAPVFEELGLQPVGSIVVGVIKTAGERLAVPGEPVQAAAAGREAILANLSRVEAEILGHPQGKRLIAFFRRHYPELAALVHHRRRVTVAWHRGKGPAFVAAGMIALRDSADSLPQQVSGQRLVDSLRAMHAALRVEASPELVSMLERVAEPLISEVARSTRFEDLLAALGNLSGLDPVGDA
jgi:hypothetical protein